MALPSTLVDREHQKFSELNSSVAVNVNVLSGLLPISYDYVAVTYPTTTTEQFVFKLGGISGTTVATVLLTYTDTTKANLSSVAKS